MSLQLDKLTMEDRVVLAQSSGLMAIFEDPISFEIMDKAMMTPCGHSFSEDTINNWILKKNQCPLCNKTLKKSDVLPNYALRNAIARFLTAQSHLQQNIQSSLGNVSVSSEWTTPQSPTQQDDWKTEEGVPTSTDSKLLIEVISARDLKTDWFGNTDPYCVLEFQDQKRKTTVVHRNRCPAWGEVNVMNMHAESNIVITVWDKDRILKDSFIGMVTVSMAEVITTLKMVRRFVLQKKRVNSRKKIGGDILLRIQFLDLRANYEYGRSTQSSLSPISSRVSTPPSLASSNLSSPPPHQIPSPIPYVQASPPAPPPLPSHSPMLPRRALAYPPSPAPPSPAPPRNAVQPRRPPSRVTPLLNRYGYGSGSSSDIASGSGSGSSSSRVVRESSVVASASSANESGNKEAEGGEYRLRASSSEPIHPPVNNDDSDAESDTAVVARESASANGSVDRESAAAGGDVRNEEEPGEEDESEDEENEEESPSAVNNRNNENDEEDDGDAEGNNNNPPDANNNFENNEDYEDNFGNDGDDNNNNNNNNNNEEENTKQRNESAENFEQINIELDVDIGASDLSNSRGFPNKTSTLLSNNDTYFSDDWGVLPPPPPPPVEESSEKGKKSRASPFPFFPTDEQDYSPPAASLSPSPPPPIPPRPLTQSNDIITNFISDNDHYTTVPSPLSPSPSPLSPQLASHQLPLASPPASPSRKLDNDFAFTSVGLSPSSRKHEKSQHRVRIVPPVETLPPLDYNFEDEPRQTTTSVSRNNEPTVRLAVRRDSEEVARQMYEELHALQFQLQLKDAIPPFPKPAAMRLYTEDDEEEEEEEEAEEELTRERHRNNKPNSNHKSNSAQNSPSLRAPASPPSFSLPNPLSLSSPQQLASHPPSPTIIYSQQPHTPPITRALTKFNTAPLFVQLPPPSPSPSPARATTHGRRNSSVTTHNNKQPSSNHSSPRSSPRSSASSSAHSSTQSTPSHSRNNSITNASIKNNRGNSVSRNQAAALSLEPSDPLPEPPIIQLTVPRSPALEVRVVANEDSIRSLMEMGFERDLAEFALKSCNNEMELALDKLLNSSGQLQFELLRSLLFTN